MIHICPDEVAAAVGAFAAYKLYGRAICAWCAGKFRKVIRRG